MKAKDIEIQIYTKSNKELLKFLHDNYNFTGLKKLKSFKSNIDQLKVMERDLLEHGISRMKALEDIFDLSKFLGPTIVLILAVLTTYNSFFESILPFGKLLFSLIVLVGVFLYISYQVGVIKGDRAVVIYFRSQLEFALEEKSRKENL